MIFKLVPAFGVILLASHVCCPPPSREWYGIDRPLPAALNVDREGLLKYKIGQFSQLNWDQFATAILKQKGSLIPREDDVALQLEQSMEVGPQEVHKNVLRHVGWYPLNEKENVGKGLFLWSQAVEADVKREGKYTKILECAYPYSIPKGVEHYVAWFRVGFLDDDSFTSIGITMSNNPERVRALKEYIDHFDFYGHYGLPQHLANLPNDQKLLFAHPTPQDVWHSQEVPRQIVTRDQGIAAIEAAGKRVNDYLKLSFSEDEYEVVWNLPPSRWRSIIGPDHFHVFRYPKALRS